jgi:hypothetical protein
MTKRSWALSLSNQFDFSTSEKFFLKCLFGILNFNHCDLPFDLAQGGEVVSPSTLLRTVSLSNGLSNHLAFVICYLKFLIADTPGPDLTLYESGR